MRYIVKPSYIRCIKSIKDIRRRKAIHQAVAILKDSIEIKLSPPAGLGLKKIRENFWEIRTSIADRIIFCWSKDLIEFIIVGDHDEIHKFLRKK